MGLDMYLRVSKFVSGWDQKHADNRQQIFSAINLPPSMVSEDSSATVQVTVAYWRKANQIHSWFVRNVQDGKDECQESSVSLEQLTTLRDLCKKVIETKDDSLLEPMAGFFFGSVSIDEYYWEGIEETITKLSNVISFIKEERDRNSFWEITYRASW